jgi:hypothetical protein
MRECPIQCVRRSIEHDRLINQIVIRSSLHLDRQMIPGIVVRVAGNSRRHPARILVIPNIPFVPARDPAFVTER